MKVGLILLTFLLLGCALPPKGRKPSSQTALRLGVADRKNSRIQLFPSATSPTGEEQFHYLFLELKNSQGQFVDCPPEEILLRTSKSSAVPFKLERLLIGRYYLLLSEKLGVPEVDVLIKGELLHAKLKLPTQRPDRDHSKIALVKNVQNKMTFRLHLADAQNRPIELLERPEIFLEGLGSVVEITPIGGGSWEFSVRYPEFSQIMYFSIRAQGVYFERFFRHHYVEK
jgi:hypothetical protein